jgi:hypothetical protein
MHLPVDDAEHQLQVLRDPRSSALMHFRGDASAAQRAADASGSVLHALVRLLRPGDRLAIREHRHPLADRVQVFPRERENVGQEGLDALVRRALPAMPPVGPALSLTPSRYAGQARGARRRQARHSIRAKGP